jgi:putative lipoprotein
MPPEQKDHPMRTGLAHVAIATISALAFLSLASAQGDAKVTGTVRYLERIALPPSEVRVTLQDVSRADASATILAEQRFDSAGNQPPYLFELSYDPAQIQDNGRYVVRAEIRTEGQLVYTTTESYPVITGGNPSTADLIVRRVAGDSGSGTAAPTAPSALPSTGGQGGPTMLLVLAACVSLVAGLALRKLIARRA